MPAFKPFDLGCEPTFNPRETVMQDGWDTFLVFEPIKGNGEFVIVECIAADLKVVHRARNYEEAFKYVYDRFMQH